MKAKRVSINELIKENDFKHYLEIGLPVGHNINLIECENKVGVDPNYKDEVKNGEPTRKWALFAIPSDEYFELNKNVKHDLIFIDGDHDCTQIEKDIRNAWYSLRIGGMIVIHDSFPPSKAHQIVPRQQTSWTGTVWRSVVGFIENHPKIEVSYIPEKYGLTVIKKNRAKVLESFNNTEMSYEYFAKNAIELLTSKKD